MWRIASKKMNGGRDICLEIVTGPASQQFNSLAPGKFEWNFRCVIFKRILVIAGWGISCEIGLIWMSLDLTDDQSTLVLVMAWCPQATSHYLSQCWPRSLPPYGVTRLQWVNQQLTMTWPKSVFTITLYWWIFLSYFRWAVSTVMTRQNQIPCDGNPSQSCMALIPLWDMCNHTEGQVSALQNTLTQCSGCHFNR